MEKTANPPIGDPATQACLGIQADCTFLVVHQVDPLSVKAVKAVERLLAPSSYSHIFPQIFPSVSESLFT